MKAINTTKTLFGILLAASLALAGPIAHAGVAGHVQFVNGTAQIITATGAATPMKKGDAIHESDTVTTTNAASVQIRMRDGALLAVRPDSTLKIDSYVFSGKEDGTEKSFFSLLKGGLRAITGTIGQKNKSSFRIAAGSSTIGIRGTDHETYVVVPGSAMAAVAPIGTYNKVNSGETTMTNGKGTINILPNQMGFTPSADQMPQLLPVNVNIFAAVPPPTLQGTGGQTIAEQGRESTVVDSSVQEHNVPPETTVPATPTLRPITEDRGPTAPPRVF